MSAPSADNRVEDLHSERRRVLEGSGLETEEASDFLAGLDRLRFASVLLAAGASRPRIQPRGGFPSFDKQRALILALDSAGADFVPLTIDSYTRQNDHAGAAKLLEQGKRDGQDLLNGYPLVAHGHLRSRDLFDGVDRPVSLRHGTPDARLLVEVALASGVTEIEGGGISYTLPYSRDFPLDRALLFWQYVDRVCAASGGLDAPVHRESFGVLTATMVPPVIVIVVQLCELLLAAEQGVTSFSVSFGQTGSLEQDLAVAAVLREKSTEVLDRFGFEGVRVRLAYHQWMGAFPADRDLASHAIAASSVGAALSGADKVVVKTRDEAF
ncbi:MAG: methylaspartate mutase, partial [Acidimicrobiia bacterium]